MQDIQQKELREIEMIFDTYEAIALHVVEFGDELYPTHEPQQIYKQIVLFRQKSQSFVQSLTSCEAIEAKARKIIGKLNQQMEQNIDLALQECLECF